ncbi:CHAT domain-containing protein [Saccharothrix australiensis]|uniref:CHAT domain-containing protein n=1 Tax=Saccharothrix australiensis TaxID=2072 RepID=A0A495VYV8_9PSEU|nr:CHAT domain-containing protein [Saccharothrix australiensis]RKT54384.1 CHAT domain-containing protein [Saccharothrix australiensis]
MTLPRVVVDLTPSTAGPGWSVRVRGAGVDAEHELAAVRVQVGGEACRVPAAPVEAVELARLLDRIRRRSTVDGDVRRYGQWLFAGLLGPVWERIRTAQAVCAARGVELALRWPVDQTDLHRLVWEAMHDGRAPLAADPDLLVAITRLVPVETGAVHTIERTPRVLFAVGGSMVDEVIRPGAMFMGLLRGFDARGVCSAKAAQTVTVKSLTDHCTGFRPDLVHIVAHGDSVDGRGSIVLGDGEQVTAEQLVPALTGARRPLAVVLSACGSGSTAAPGGGPLAAELVEQGIPIVSAVSGEVSEQACRLYTRRLVEAIGDGTPLAVAAAQGRRAALLDSSSPRDQLDWAMPSLFLSESVPSSFRPVDAKARRIVEIADSLKLREWPLFIGRTSILDLVDDLFADEVNRRLSVIGAIGDDISGMGGTRLLRELGYMLLLRGHLPLLLGPFDPTKSPSDLRAMLGAVLDCMAILATELDLPVPRFRLLEPHYPAEAAAEDPGRAAYAARMAFYAAKARFAADAVPLDWGVATTMLTADLETLAVAAEDLAEPFGPHSRVVVLADEIHRWGVVGDLLDHLKAAGRNGFGSRARPVPVVFTASTGVASGAAVRSFSERMANMPGHVFPQLGPLPVDEGVIGFQWVLLNPPSPRAGDGGTVYAALPKARYDDFVQAFKFFEGRPTVVREPVLYRVAEMLEHFEVFVTGDDHAAWTRYEERYS